MEDLQDPPDEAYDDGGFAERPYAASLADACSSMVDEVAAIERTAARQRAWQVEIIDDARRLAELTERGLITVDSTLSAIKGYEMVRRSLVAELSCALRMPEVTIDGMLTTSEALMHRLPATMTALRAGDISYRHAEVIADQVATLSDEAALLLENEALPFAATVTVSKLRAKAKVLRERLDPNSIAERVARSAQDRRVEFIPADDGMAWLNLYTTAPEATSIFTAVRDHALALQNPNDPRTLAQLSADVCADALSAALAGELGEVRGASGGRERGEGDGRGNGLTPDDRSGRGNGRASGRGSGVGHDDRSGTDADRNGPSGGAQGSGTEGSGAQSGGENEPGDKSEWGRTRSTTAFGRIRPSVTVTVPALTLLGASDEPGDLEGYGPIDAETARALAGQSNTWYRMLTDPATGIPLSLDSTSYRPSAAMKRFLRYRDGTCRFPGCNRAAKHCDIDHTKAAEFGGPTECDNLSHLCRKHHRLKHQTTWKVTQSGSGVLEWTSPGNRTYVTEPAVLFPPGEPPPGAPPPTGDGPPAPAPPADAPQDSEATHPGAAGKTPPTDDTPPF